MAKIDKLYKSMGLPMNIKRGNPWPLDASSVHYSYEDMKAYAEDVNGVGYVGQILALVDETGKNAKAYIIVNEDGALKEVGSGPLVDNKTIVIDSESKVLGLKDFGKRFYKYVPEQVDEESGEVLVEATYRLVEVDDINPWKAGLELRVASEDGEFVLGWYEPNPTTIEGINNQVVGLQTSVNDLQKVTENLTSEIGKPAEGEAAATGLYGELDKKANAANVYDKDTVDVLITEAIAAADHLQRKIVTSYTDITTFITENGADEAAKYIFMVPEEDTTADGNIYEEYMVINGVIEVVGKWATDLSDYVTSSALNTKLEDYVLETDLTTTLAGYATTGDVEDVAGDLTALGLVVDGKVDAQTGYSLISNEDLEKLHNLDENGEANFVKEVSSDFTVDEATGTLSLNTNDLDLSGNKTVAPLSTKVSGLETSVNSINSSLTALENSINANATEIGKLQSAQTTMNEAIEKNKTDISSLNGKVTTLEESLNALSGTVTGHGNKITSLETQLSSFVLKADYDTQIAEIKDILTWKTIGEESVA